MVYVRFVCYVSMLSLSSVHFSSLPVSAVCNLGITALRCNAFKYTKQSMPFGAQP